MSIQERLQIIIKMHNLSPSAFADQIGVQRSNVSHVLSGRNKPGLDFLEKIINTFPRVNAHWLISGDMPEPPIAPTTVNEEDSVPYDTRKAERGSQKEIERIVIFYKDNTFDTYTPSSEG